MVPCYLLIFPLAFSHSISATTLGRRTADLSSPEPRIFHNLTKDEFHAKLLDYRGSSPKRTVSDSAEEHGPISKRVPFREEDRNDAVQQSVVEQRAEQCMHIGGHHYRPLHGFCEEGNTMFWYCDHVDEPWTALKALRKTCKTSKKHPAKCVTMSVYNFKGLTVKLPYCADIIVIDEKEKEVDSTPLYEGYKTLPDEVWSPGTIDAFYEMAGQLPGLKGNFEYRGHFTSGKTFISQSPKQAHSWACLGCPSGTLYVQTVGFKAEALGFSLAAGSWL